MGAETDKDPDGEKPEGELDPNPQVGAGDGSDDGDGDLSKLPEGVRRTLINLRQKEREGIKLAKANADLATRLQKLEDATKTEEQRTKDELARLKQAQSEWETGQKKWAMESAVQTAVFASQAKPSYASLVIQEVMKQPLETDDAGKPTPASIKAALKAVQSEYGDLFNPATPNPGTTQPPAPGKQPPTAPPSGAPTNPARPPSGDATFTRSQVGDRAFYVANKDAILRAYREGKIIDDTE